jgi:hypothetical protein
MASSPRLRVLAFSSLLLAGAACAGRGGATIGDDNDGSVVATSSEDAGEGDAMEHSHDMPPSSQPDKPVVLGPSCDEDNPIKNDDYRGDKPLPAPILQFQRQRSWGCMHREWHDTNVWDILEAGKDTIYVSRWTYMQKMGWKRPTIVEGQPGNGLDFLSMHRAMLIGLRNAFPSDAALFAGWTTPPTTSTTDDPVPVAGDAGAPAFATNMQNALTRIANDLAAFPSDDALGIWLQSQVRPTQENPAARSDDPTSGIHAYYHVRFDDRQSAIRMQRFNRNIENRAFWRLHGWIDGVWSKYRKAKGLVDATDQNYVDAMMHACMHMEVGHWDKAKNTCVP